MDWTGLDSHNRARIQLTLSKNINSKKGVCVNSQIDPQIIHSV